MLTGKNIPMKKTKFINCPYANKLSSVNYKKEVCIEIISGKFFETSSIQKYLKCLHHGLVSNL